MNKSETIGALAAALSKSQGEIKSAVKDATNPFFKSSYADLPAIVKACKASLAANGIAYIQTTDFLDQETWLETILAHSSGEWVSGRYPVRPVKNDPQGMGSAITYARRYSLAAMVGVVSENEDDDAEAAQGRTPQAAAIHGPKATAQAPALAEDQDVVEGVANWLAQQKDIITACQTLPDLNGWLDANGGDLLKPASGSVLDRLNRKSKPAFNELKTYYLNKLSKV